MYPFVTPSVALKRLFYGIGAIGGCIVFRKLYWPFCKRYYNLPPGPAGYPLIGSFPDLYFNTTKYLQYISNEYGDISSVFIGFNNLILINNANLAKKIFSNKNFVYKPFGSAKKDTSIQQLFVANGDEWKTRRKNFSTSIIARLDSKTVNTILYNVLHKKIFTELDTRILYHKDEGFVINDLIHLAVFNVIHVSAFGKMVSMNNENYQIIKEFVTSMFANKNPFYPGRASKTAAYIMGKFDYKQKLEYDKEMKARENKNIIFYNLIKHKIDQYNVIKTPSKQSLNSSVSEHIKADDFMCMIDDNNDESKYDDDDGILITKGFVDIMLESQQGKNDDNLSFDHILDDIGTAFTAGLDITTSVIEVIIYHLVLYPKLQEKLYNELSQCIDNANNRYFELKMQLKCHLFRAFIHESMRMFGNGPVSTPRSCIKDTYITNDADERKYLMPKHSIIVVNAMSLCSKQSSNNKIWGDNLNKFDIYRFIDDNGKFKYNDNFHIFSFGRRDCPAKSLAMKDITLIVSNLILNYKFKPVNNDLEQFKLDFKNNKKTYFLWQFDPALKLSITKRK